MKRTGADLRNTSDALLAEIGERQRAEEALGASEQRLQDILDNTTAVVFVKDLDLRYILVNREYERRHQVQRDQIRGKTDFDILPHDVAEKVRANDWHVIEAGAPIQFEFVDRDGKPVVGLGVSIDRSGPLAHFWPQELRSDGAGSLYLPTLEAGRHTVHLDQGSKPVTFDVPSLPAAQVVLHVKTGL